MPVLATQILLASLTIGISATAVFAEKKIKTKPATKEQIYLYRGISASFVCNARLAEVDFPKAVGIAAATYAQLLNGRHGGLVASAGKKKLTTKLIK